MIFLFQLLHSLTIGVWKLHTDSLRSRVGEVTLTSSGEGKHDEKDEKGDSGAVEGEESSKLRL